MVERFVDCLKAADVEFSAGQQEVCTKGKWYNIQLGHERRNAHAETE